MHLPVRLDDHRRWRSLHVMGFQQNIIKAFVRLHAAIQTMAQLPAQSASTQAKSCKMVDEGIRIARHLRLANDPARGATKQTLLASAETLIPA